MPITSARRTNSPTEVLPTRSASLISGSSLIMLRARRERPRGSRAAEQPDELPSL
jgi:hypothetical protein